MNNAPISKAKPLISWVDDPRGRELAKTIALARFPQWSQGPRDFQLDSWLRVLDGTNQLDVIATGGGKTALFYGPVAIAEYLHANPMPGVKPLPDKPLSLVVVPLIELGNNHVSNSISIEHIDNLPFCIRSQRCRPLVSRPFL